MLYSQSDAEWRLLTRDAEDAAAYVLIFVSGCCRAEGLPIAAAVATNACDLFATDASNSIVLTVNIIFRTMKVRELAEYTRDN